MNSCSYFKLILLLIISFTFSSAEAQIHEEYIKGTILFKNNSKASGYIRNDEQGKLKYTFNFKSTNDTEQGIKYDTSSVKGFVMENGEVYDLLVYKLDAGKDSLRAFARLMIKGKASLYQVLYGSKCIYIIQNNNTTYPIQDEEMHSDEPILIDHHYKRYLTDALIDSDNLLGLIERINKMEFSVQELKKLVSDYNKNYPGQNSIIHFNEKSKGFVLFNADASYPNSDNNLLSFEGAYRFYYPKFSKSICYNFGIKYLQYSYSSQEKFTISTNSYPYYINIDTTVNYKQTWLSVPVSIHQNLLNKRFRPYLFVGFNFVFSYKEVNDIYYEDNGHGFQNNFGILYSWGGGIEADIYKGLMLRAEYRKENQGFVTFGIGYHIKTR